MGELNPLLLRAIPPVLFSSSTQCASHLPLSIDDAHSWTWTSGILDASCMAGVTMFIDSREFPNDKKM